MLLAKGSAHQAEAVELMKYFTARSQQRDLARDFTVVPPYRGVDSETELDSAFVAQSLEGTPLPTTPFSSPVWLPMNQALSLLYTTQDDPAQIMHDADQAIEDAIARMR
jgi:maltose-binding protein MalE